MTIVPVVYQTSLDGPLRAFMMQQLIQYVLFIRGQVPCLYDELVQFVETLQRQEQVTSSSDQRLPVSRGIKKAVKCVDALEQLFQVQLQAVFAVQVKRVALVLGSSMMSPREAFLVDFEDGDESRATKFSCTALNSSEQVDMSLEDSQTLTSLSRERLMRLCAQKLVRALFTRSMEHVACVLPATKLHIAVLAERQATRIPGFLPKQQFKLRLPKGKREIRTHYLKIRSSDDRRKQSQQEDSQHPNAEQPDTRRVANDTGVCSSSLLTPANSCDSSDMVWYVLEKPIAGFSEVINTLGGQ